MNLGRSGEDLVARHYQEQGGVILERNYIFRRGRQSGELDLVIRHGARLIFVEVKTRRSRRFGSAAEAVDWSKQRKLVRTAKLYLLVHRQYAALDYQFDVATVDIDNPAQPVIIIPNAIEDFD